MKRKSDGINDGRRAYDATNQTIKEAESSQDSIGRDSRQDIVLHQHANQYAHAKPYNHFVIPRLMDDDFLRKVRAEILENVHFTLKETDIYRIHRSTNLASLDGLHDEALSKFPTLLRLRDALYSSAFRNYISTVTNCGALSGRKTDMAINLYTPGCYLLCHDDVFCGRRVSYILHLTDPDIPWQKEWGGASRLYPRIRVGDGGNYYTPSPFFSKVIPPSWNQLSFFAARPGESFHDVEEGYHAKNKDQLEKNGGRIRIAISGWFHIPQIGEYRYIEGDKQRLFEKSLLLHIYRKLDQFDLPQLLATKFSFKGTKDAEFVAEDAALEDTKDVELEVTEDAELEVTEDPELEGTEYAELEVTDTDFLLKYLAPTYLMPGTMQQVADHFTENSSAALDYILSKKFSMKLREHFQKQELTQISSIRRELGAHGWKVARPPHKHRFLFLQDSSSLSYSPQAEAGNLSPVEELLYVLLPSPPFRKWLELVTKCGIGGCSIMARRFRRGLDYEMGKAHEGKPRLEVSLCMTPTSGWGDDESYDSENELGWEGTNTDILAKLNGKSKAKGKAKAVEKEKANLDVGGQEIYLAHDEEAGNDAAVYGTKTDAECNTIQWTIPATWNKMSIVLRRRGVVKFVRYVSKSAKVDRWDISGVYGVEEENCGRML